MNIFKNLLDIIFPPFCISCEEILPDKRFIICNNCYSILPRVNKNQINAFLTRIEERHFDDIFILFHFSELFQKLMHYFKYEGYIEVAEYFAETIRNSILKKYEIITSVPLHASKKKERGFNQSEILAVNVCKSFGISYENTLNRNRYTPSQTKLSRNKRKENIQNAFDVVNDVMNKSILLIDDVITTGATLNECAKVLKQEGAKKVDIIAMATPVDILQQKLESERL